MKQVILTKQGVEKITEELEHIKTVKTQRAASRLEKAKDYGDREDIRDAREESEFYRKRILTLEEMLSTAKVLA